VRAAVGFFAGLYAQQARRAYAAHVRGDLHARLGGREGRLDPYPIYERIRARGPFVPTMMGNLATADHAICNEVLRSRSFGVRPAEPAYDPDGPDPGGLSMLTLNPPDHTRLRRIATPGFGPKAIAGYRPLVSERVHALVDAVEGRRDFDFVTAIAAPLPIAVITTLLGVPEGRAGEFEHYGQVIGSALTGVRGIRHALQLQRADAALTAIFADLFALRRADPGDDVISLLLAAEGPEGIHPAELSPMCQLLLVAGFETTVNVLGNAILAFAAHPDQWERLVADPSLAPRAAEEALRYDSSVQRTDRIALTDVEVAGTTVRKGQSVLTLLGGANRDPAVFDRPAAFDITRANASDHLAFSSGVHYCLGQPLARLELSVALEVLATRLPRLHPIGRPRYRPSTLLRGPRSLRVSGRSSG
jgi:cytochrome P450